MPWIAIDDVVGAIQWCMSRQTLRGPVNLVSPTPTTNAQFTRELASAVHRPALLQVPAFALRLALGDGANALLQGQNVEPAALLRDGYQFKYPSLNLALTAAVARST
jgi:uncharacterized protein